MSFLTRLVSNLVKPASTSIISNTNTVRSQILDNYVSATGQNNLLGLQSVRTVIRIHFPRPSERKRIKRHGWKARMATPGGRRTIMRRILKGCFVLTH